MKTSTLVVGSSFVAVKVLSADPVALVTVREDDSVTGWPTTSIIVAAPLSTDVAVQYAGGSAVTFPAPPLTRWAQNQIVGFVKAVTGSTTFQQVEQ